MRFTRNYVNIKKIISQSQIFQELKMKCSYLYNMCHTFTGWLRSHRTVKKLLPVTSNFISTTQYHVKMGWFHVTLRRKSHQRLHSICNLAWSYYSGLPVYLAGCLTKHSVSDHIVSNGRGNGSCGRKCHLSCCRHQHNRKSHGHKLQKQSN
jgi:hypothetical protein